MPGPRGLPRTNGWWTGSLQDLGSGDPVAILEKLASHQAGQGLTVRSEHLYAWEEEIDALGRVAATIPGEAASWGAIIEFVIPRRPVRPDAVILAGDVVVPLEFKVGSATYERAARMQVEEYARDLRDFHEGS